MHIEGNIQESIYCFGLKIREWVGVEISLDMEGFHGGSKFVRFSDQKLAYLLRKNYFVLWKATLMMGP